MKFPDTIRILGKTWAVEWCDFIVSDEDNYGAVHWAEQKIRLQTNLPADQTEETLLHEIMHIIDLNAALNMEEEEVRRLANNLHQVIADNGCLFCGAGDGCDDCEHEPCHEADLDDPGDAEGPFQS